MGKYLEVGQTVYLRTDVDQRSRIVTAITVTQSGVSYELSCGVDKTWHFPIEISTERNILMTTNN
jgi:hypothetical protein